MSQDITKSIFMQVPQKHALVAFGSPTEYVVQPAICDLLGIVLAFQGEPLPVISMALDSPVATKLISYLNDLKRDHDRNPSVKVFGIDSKPCFEATSFARMFTSPNGDTSLMFYKLHIDKPIIKGIPEYPIAKEAHGASAQIDLANHPQIAKTFIWTFVSRHRLVLRSRRTGG